ncbi:MAG: guanylate kinase [Opitutales bacterium]
MAREGHSRHSTGSGIAASSDAIVYPRTPPAHLFVLSGPAGSGKTTLCYSLIEFDPNLSRVVTATTRSPRPGEVNGRDYHFLSVEDFLKKRRTHAFYETAEVHGLGRYYGTLKEEVNSRLEAGHDLLLNIDVQGAQSFREAAEKDPDLARRLVTIFILPPSLKALQQRLEGRGSDDKTEIQRRMVTAKAEMRRWNEYDYCVVSGTPEEDLARVHAIIVSFRYQVARPSTRYL